MKQTFNQCHLFTNAQTPSASAPAKFVSINFWSRALTDAEVDNLAAGGRGPTDTQPKWSFTAETYDGTASPRPTITEAMQGLPGMAKMQVYFGGSGMSHDISSEQGAGKLPSCIQKFPV